MMPSDPKLKVPQIGWNTLTPRQNHPLLEGILTGPDGYHAYFVHSYHLNAAQAEDVVATTEYGMEVTAIVARDNMVGNSLARLNIWRQASGKRAKTKPKKMPTNTR